LGPDLERQDKTGALERILRPWGRFRASSKSTFDQLCYFAMILASLGFFAVLARLLHNGSSEGRLRSAALAYLVLVTIGVWGFFNVVDWI
jgi:hypothetical protein